MSWYASGGKRALDLLAATIGGLVTLPVQLVVAGLVRKNLGSPVLFRQQRPGKDGEPFELVKFRTMTDERDSEGELLPDAERLPRFGEFLRSTSLDELPELWNVIKGEMSLVGPRPLLMRYLPLYSDEQARRHEVRPGITGLAQVKGRNSLTWENKFGDDVYYVDHVSFRLDAKILWQTVTAVLRRSGVTAPGEATAQEFRGLAASGAQAARDLAGPDLHSTAG